MEKSNLVDAPALIELRGKRPNLFVLGLLGIIALSAIVLSILMIFLSPRELKFGALFFALLLLACGVFLVRSLLWNVYGTCVIKTNGENLVQYFDYGYFRSSERVCLLSEFNVDQIELTPKVSKLVLQFGDKEILVPFELTRDFALLKVEEIKTTFTLKRH